MSKVRVYEYAKEHQLPSKKSDRDITRIRR